MARLFVFAIGGTGSRVLKSLTMLLAAGVKSKSRTTYEIVPVIIDPHETNADLTRTVRLMQNYQAITDAVGNENGFFGTRVTTFDNLVGDKNGLAERFTFNLQQVSDTTFKDYIEYSKLDRSNEALANVLFSGTSINKHRANVNLLDVEMDIGFVGNPNIGSVVLNQFKDSEIFKEFASNFGQDDRIIVISSIFGGTGAAGFPIIVKNIRDAMNNPKIDGKGFLQDAKIGAITVLPYFNIQTEEDSPIQRSHFISKTKSALYYYRDNLTGNRSVNAMYYVGDDHNGIPYENDPGDGGQRNDAHLVELASALAVIDFLDIPDERLRSADGRAVEPMYKEFGIKDDHDEITFDHLEDPTASRIAANLAQFLLFKRYLDDHILGSVESQPWSIKTPEIDRQFLDSAFYRTNILEFMRSFDEWLEEMEQNLRGFAPFNRGAELEVLIKGKSSKSGFFDGKMDYRFYDSRLNSEAKDKYGTYVSAPQKLINLFFKTTEDILRRKFGY